MSSDIAQILGIALGYLIATLVRYLRKGRFWRSIAANARRTLDDPSIPIDDPRSATESALLAAQSQRIQKVVETISPPPSMPRTPTVRGMQPPPVRIQIPKVKDDEDPP